MHVFGVRGSSCVFSRTQYFDQSVSVPLCRLSFLPRWWGACAQRDSVGSSVGTLQTCVEENLVSEGCGASQSPSPASSPVESVRIILSRREHRDTSVLSTVCSTCMTLVCKQMDLIHCNLSHSCFYVSQTCATHRSPSPATKMPSAAARNKTTPAHVSLALRETDTTAQVLNTQRIHPTHSCKKRF